MEISVWIHDLTPYYVPALATSFQKGVHGQQVKCRLNYELN